MQLNRQAAGIGHLWKRIVVLLLCVCLLTAGSARGAKNQLLSVSALETKQLRKLLKGKRISAILADGTNLLGRVKKVQDGLVVVDIQESPGSSPVEPGLQEIPTDRISTVHFTRYQGKWKAGLGTLFSVGGLILARGVVGDCEGCERGEPGIFVGIWSAMTVLGYLLGIKKDKKNVTLVIKQPEASGGALN